MIKIKEKKDSKGGVRALCELSKGEGTTHIGVGGGGGKGFGGGPARREGTLENRILGGVIPHQGGARGAAGLDPKRRGGPLLKYA